MYSFVYIYSCPNWYIVTIETVDLIDIYENLQRLYSAAWVIYQRLSNDPYLKENESNKYPEVELTKASSNKIRLYQLNSIIPITLEETISKLIAVIKHKVPSVQAIFYLGIEPNEPGTIYLLILTSNDEQKQAQALSGTIEDSCKDIAEVFVLVHHAAALFTGLHIDNLFFNKALHAHILYLSGDLLLPAAKPLAKFHSDETLMLKWDRWHRQGIDFLLGAEYYLKIDAYGACLFSLHQCVESLLIAVIRAVLGYNVNNHNLFRLLNIKMMFTDDLVAVFDLENAGSALLFDQLKHAYVNVRYKDSYEPDAKSIVALYITVKIFVEVVQKVYEIHLLVNSL